jgi:enoyl-CoA hydratase/carnithine racemase
MSTFETIVYQQNGPILVVMLNRPEAMNALSPQLIKELGDAMRMAATDDTVKIVIVTGAGRAWSAGVDLKALNESISGGIFTMGELHDDSNNIIKLIQTMPKPCIAAVNGYCFTGALELMMGFDIIIAAEEAKIGDTHAKWGILPKWGMSQRLSQLVGPLKARELSFTCEAITGKEAARIGLVNKAVPLDQLDDAVNEMANKILSNSAQTVAAMKHLYYEGEQTTLKEGLQIEQDYQVAITDREEFLRNFSKNK